MADAATPQEDCNVAPDKGVDAAVEAGVDVHTHGLILFGHGARDPRWAEPFEQLAARIRADASGAHAGAPVTLAYLEMMTPDLGTAIAAQISAGCRTITVVPVFFGQGAHLRRDFPLLLAACQAAHPRTEIRVSAPVGEAESVQEAITRYALAQRAPH